MLSSIISEEQAGRCMATLTSTSMDTVGNREEALQLLRDFPVLQSKFLRKVDCMFYRSGASKEELKALYDSTQSYREQNPRGQFFSLHVIPLEMLKIMLETAPSTYLPHFELDDLSSLSGTSPEDAEKAKYAVQKAVEHSIFREKPLKMPADLNIDDLQLDLRQLLGPVLTSASHVELEWGAAFSIDFDLWTFVVLTLARSQNLKALDTWLVPNQFLRDHLVEIAHLVMDVFRMGIKVKTLKICEWEEYGPFRAAPVLELLDLVRDTVLSCTSPETIELSHLKMLPEDISLLNKVLFMGITPQSQLRRLPKLVLSNYNDGPPWHCPSTEEDGYEVQGYMAKEIAFMSRTQADQREFSTPLAASLLWGADANMRVAMCAYSDSNLLWGESIPLLHRHLEKRIGNDVRMNGHMFEPLEFWIHFTARVESLSYRFRFEGGDGKSSFLNEAQITSLLFTALSGNPSIWWPKRI